MKHLIRLKNGIGGLNLLDIQDYSFIILNNQKMMIDIKYSDAAILVEQNKELIVDKIQLPGKLDFGHLVEVHVSGICGSQIGEISGAKGPDKYLPLY